MARYYFHTEGAHRFHDEEGHDFPDESDVAAEALAFLVESLRNQHESFWETSSYRVVVTDAEGLILYVLDLSGVEAPAIKRRRLATLDAKVQSSEEPESPANGADRNGEAGLHMPAAVEAEAPHRADKTIADCAERQVDDGDVRCADL